VASKKAPAADTLEGLSASILDALPIGLYVIDREMRVVAWNHGREQGPLGQPRRKVLGQPLSRVLPARSYKALRPVLHRIFATGIPHE